MNEKKLCPFAALGTTPCDKSCALYVEEEGECAIKLIARYLATRKKQDHERCKVLRKVAEKLMESERWRELGELVKNALEEAREALDGG